MNQPYDIELGDKLKKKLEKLEKKDKSIYNTIIKKILQLADNPYIGKPLHGKLKGKRKKSSFGKAFLFKKRFVEICVILWFAKQIQV